MPNWVQNEIYLRGNEEDIKKVEEFSCWSFME